VIITQTPLRISFFGGGTDYPAHYKLHGGATLSTSINKYTVITVQRVPQFADYCDRVNYSRVESVNSIDEIQHPSARECLRFLGIQEGVEIHYVSDLPARTGLGSSSSATVGLLMALHAFKGEVVSRERVAAEAVYVEQEMIKERVGSQDQYACALGGFMHLQFHQDLRVQADPVVLLPERLNALQERLMLMYTGIQRRAHEVLDEQLQRTETGEITADLYQLRRIVDQGLAVLAEGRDLSDFGALLHDSWLIKRGLSSKISMPGTDSAYDRARVAGAIGGKLLGAGSGGFLLLFVEPQHRSAVLRAVPELRITDFALENSGSRIIFYRS
jgi:D-glycero-alpha-D-manno-heptose-7-phosphate kinase